MHMGTGLHEQALADAVVRMVGAGAPLDRTYHVPHVPHVPHGPTACPLHARLTWRVSVWCGVVWCGVGGKQVGAGVELYHAVSGSMRCSGSGR